MVNTVRRHLNVALATHVCMEDIAKTSVQVLIALVRMITLVLVASMNMMHVQRGHATMGLLVLIMVLVTPVSVHMVTLVSYQSVLSLDLLYRVIEKSCNTFLIHVLFVI